MKARTDFLKNYQGSWHCNNRNYGSRKMNKQKIFIKRFIFLVVLLISTIFLMACGPVDSPRPGYTRPVETEEIEVERPVMITPKIAIKPGLIGPKEGIIGPLATIVPLIPNEKPSLRNRIINDHESISGQVIAYVFPNGEMALKIAPFGSLREIDNGFSMVGIAEVGNESYLIAIDLSDDSIEVKVSLFSDSVTITVQQKCHPDLESR
jgi:hypothetical protein